MKNFDSVGVQVPRIFLPRPGINLTHWAVIACDQFTSQPEYWHGVAELTENSPSTYHLVLPEVMLETLQEPALIQQIQATMHAYLRDGILQPFDGLIYVERSVSDKTRRGLVLALDLERYDYSKGSQSLIRATEGTIVERLPPRMKIREGAPLELPHILVLIDDPRQTVIEPVAAAIHSLEKAYDFELMCGSGHLTGYKVDQPELHQQVIRSLEALAGPEAFRARYGVGEDQAVLLFAMGDGNHSLATAKAIWEKLKPQVGLDHPARYALVEIENVHDQGLEFEPIHRVLFNLKTDLLAALADYCDGQVRLIPCAKLDEMTARVDGQGGPAQQIGLVLPDGFAVIEIACPSSNLPVGSLQAFLDHFMRLGGAEKIDYVHGLDVVTNLGSQPGNAGFYLPAMVKDDLFKTVILDGALPRKTFSMGAAHEKRFYMEARMIIAE